MKRLFRLFPVFALLTGVWACSDDKTSEVRINDGTEFLSLDYLARSGKIIRQCSGTMERGAGIGRLRARPKNPTG